MIRVAAALLSFSTITGVSRAQAPATTARSSAIAEATRLGNAGQTAAARALIDSLVKITPADAPDLDQVIFLRATFAPSVLDATFDYQKIIADPSSGRRREALVRVAQRALIAGDPGKALDYLKTLAQDYPDDSSLATAFFWKAAALLDTHDVIGACDANAEARSHARMSSPAMLAVIDAQESASCPRTAPVSIALIDTAITRPVPAAAKPKPSADKSAKAYAVQVSAFPKRGDAEEMAARLNKRGFDAHVDGTQRPFRVRVGHFQTYAEAAAELKKLKAKKVAGFVTVLEQ